MCSSQNSEYSVSAVIPAYNAERTIKRAVESVLKQTAPVNEVIVVDDGSKDRTAEIAESFGDQIRLIRGENRGASAARNTGIKAAGSQWIAFLDCDDYWLEEKNQLQLSVLKENPHICWSAGGYKICRDESGDAKPAAVNDEFDESFAASYLDLYPQGLNGHTDTMLIKRSLLIEAGLFDENLRRSNDIDMWFRAAFRQPEILYVNSPLAVQQRQFSFITRSVMDEKIPLRLAEKLSNEAKDAGLGEEFAPSLRIILKWWILLLIRSRKSGAVRRILLDYSSLFSSRYRFSNRLGSYLPKLYYRYLQRKIPELKEAGERGDI
ncbi:putative glycosyltransferase EpsJ [Sedimentisphaera cyanobacteriorum]|uniref:Putative glycosyltransferase EpsJ n=1 Tax=Sedimentisphaera cyanobacteriorum TaxID=1940790 RepID=A0A1Q2HLT0_9BACT|nr:glycosyltransferase family A protein [Sedimentisphaera cyanobacteriorum]AQQ08408.1 putative glycosyltransferase EpsJ [Sedimentisphaera cyanobacteriorum]